MGIGDRIAKKGLPKEKRHNFTKRHSVTKKFTKNIDKLKRGL
jgi:hypothetical protein